jgi:hypothetical protein
MNEVFIKHAKEIVRVSVLPPQDPVVQATPTTTTTTATKAKNAWVPHPSPRNVVKVPEEKVIEA